MQRRQFLARGLGLAASSLCSGIALADSATYQKFHHALEQTPELALYADTVADLAGTARLEGHLPRDLQGVFFRNGPGRFELQGERYHHWFDGDGFAQRWQIANGKVSHSGKFIRTHKFVTETRAGKFLYPTFGTWFDRAGVKNNDTINAANTNLLPFNGKLYALWEGGSATELDPVTLATKGIKTWRDDLQAMPFSAHPKTEIDGNLWNFGTLPGSDQLALYHLAADGRVINFGIVKIPQLAMVHDFVMSAAHLIFLIPPYDLVGGANLSFVERHQWAGSGTNARPLRVVVVSKADLQIRQIFELPPRMVFHFGNAFDDGNTTRFDAVLHEGDVIQELANLMTGSLQVDPARRSYTSQISLDYARKTATETRLFGSSEFPRVAPQVMARRHRRLVLLSPATDKPGLLLNTVNLLNTDNGAAQSYRFDAGWAVEEHILVPRPSARFESDGYLLGVAQNINLKQTVLTVFDAAKVADGPIALAHLPYRAPHCFHGNFLTA